MYDKKLVYDYVVGNDIDGYDIDELENDYIFMKQVIDYTNDKNMYNLCSKKVKNNCNFVKYIINKFKDDSKFIISVADEYIKNNQKEDFEPNCVEIKMIMSDIGKKKNEDEFFMYTLSTIAFQEYTFSQIETVKDKLKQDNLGMGFYIVQSTYYKNPLIIEYFAKKFINQIFFENENYTFEELIHKTTKRYEIIEGLGVINYLIKYIANYDCDLSAYLYKNSYLLNKTKHTMESVKSNWNNFLREQSIRKYNMLQETIMNEYSSCTNTPSFLVSQLIDYVVENNNIIKTDRVIQEYLKLRKLKERGKYSLPKIDESKLDFAELKLLRFASSKAQEIFSKDVIGIKEYQKEDESQYNKEKTKIIKLNFK